MAKQAGSSKKELKKQRKKEKKRLKQLAAEARHAFEQAIKVRRRDYPEDAYCPGGCGKRIGLHLRIRYCDACLSSIVAAMKRINSDNEKAGTRRKVASRI